MAGKENTCRKFQANIFNKSKCQNCFKPRESHLLSDDDYTQANPIYGGWLLLAPEGTNFDNPLHRSRKWQRRFFLLYEHGLLRYALDEMASTLPQGTINLNVCVDVVDAEVMTGQKHSLCICTPDREHYIRAESREGINGWQEALIVFPRTNKQNQKKKRKVEPPTPQEPGPAKVTVTSSSVLCASNSVVQSDGAEPMRDSERVIGRRKPRVESGYFSLEKPKPEQPQQEVLSSSSSSSSLSRLRYSTSEPVLLSSHNTYDTSPDTNTTHSDFTDTPAVSQSVGAPHRSPTAHTPRSPSPLTSADTHTLASPLSSSQSSLDSESSSERRSRDVRADRDNQSEAGGINVKPGRGGRSYVALADVPRARRLSHREAFRSERKRQELRARTRSPGREEVERLFGHQRKRTQVIERFETQPSTDALEHMDTTENSSSSSQSTNQRTGRSERRLPAQKQDLSLDAGTGSSVTDFSGRMSVYRRAKSLDRRVTETSMTPDLLNFKKGWMTKLYEDGLWKKHWFVLTDQSLRYYRDSIAEEAADLDGEIDLTTCFDVTEFPVQRNYGFQIHSKEGLYTLSAMTSGIRRNWIQAIMKSVRPTISPDVTRSVPDEHANANPPTPDVPRPSHVWVQRSCDVIVDSASDHRKPRPRDRRREGRSKTFDWAEFKNERAETLDTSSSPSPSSVSSSASSPSSSISDRKLINREQEVIPENKKIHVGVASEVSKNSDVQVEIEERWHQVETTPLREEKQVPITGGPAPFSTGDKSSTELTETQKELVKLQDQNSLLQDQLHNAEHIAREGYVLQETCERGFAAMEETHQKVIEDLQRQHQREINKLLEERERLLEEETNATIAAIEAMKNAHREELEKTQRAQLSGVSTDIEQLHRQYEQELQSIHRELEVLSEQYSQKCLENTHLAQALEAERQALQQCQRENQQLHTHNQELNNRLTVEISRMRSCYSGEKTPSPLTHGKDLYELEVLLRIKDSEIQYLKQEINSLKDELQSALRDKKYASDKYKDIYTELSIVRAKADCDISKLREKLLAATEALGEKDTPSHTPGYDIMKSKSNPDFMKKERSGVSRQVRGMRSKSLKEGLTVQERMKLFESKDTRKI